METHQIRETYLAYLDCLNRQAWDELERFVDDHVRHNERAFGLQGYRNMIIQDFRDIPDLQFRAEFLVCETSGIAARLRFDCSPASSFLGLPVNGTRVIFHEHVFYKLTARKITHVWSVVDKAEIERQL